HRGPRRLLRDAAAGGERVTEDQYAGLAGHPRRGGLVTSTRADVVRLPPPVRGDRILARRIAEHGVLADEAVQVVVPNAARRSVAPDAMQWLPRDESHRR